MKLKNSMLLAVMTAVFSLSLGFEASAKKTPEGNLIVRYNPKTGQAESMVTNQKIESEAQARELIEHGDFKPMKKTKAKVRVSELDRETGASSWYVGVGNNGNGWGAVAGGAGWAGGGWGWGGGGGCGGGGCGCGNWGGGGCAGGCWGGGCGWNGGGGCWGGSCGGYPGWYGGGVGYRPYYGTSYNNCNYLFYGSRSAYNAWW